VKIKLDENIPVALCAFLQHKGHDVDTVRDEGLFGRDDSEVWAAARREGRMLVTRDIGLAGSIASSSDAHPGLMLLRLRDPGRLALRQRLIDVIETGMVAQWTNAVVVVTERKARVRKGAT
jgi:predicted nuclease of predicted toxin-antitoxin system